jgi:hypothetical protein
VNKLRVLEKKADKLFQIKLISEKPFSIVSGEPTEVIHHFIPKSQSNDLRYDRNNGVPLTNKEHCSHHLSGDSNIVATILKNYGQEWFDDLQSRRHIICKNNKERLLKVIEEFSQ